LSIHKTIEIIDYTAVMAKLKERGWSMRKINRKTGIHMATLSRLKNEPDHVPYSNVTRSIMRLYESGEVAPAKLDQPAEQGGENGGDLLETQ
jgi:transcriptional regulator with XRE-family HTH domain